jgi:Pyruvate/2-oxoacid:ferredoxin oxidoreductase gamma subunit
VEREVLLTGIGGQGVQLAATVLSRAAALEGRQAMLFGLYGGMMRGGNSDSTVVVADGPILSPPIVSRAWAGFILHARYWAALQPKLAGAAIVVANSDVVGELELGPTTARVDVAAGEIAAGLGSAMGAGMVLTGALIGSTGLVSLDAAIAAMREALPPYRQQHADLNAAAMTAGAASVAGITAAAWPSTQPAEVPA